MKWQLVSTEEIPQWFIDAVKSYTPNSKGEFAAQLLWQRSIRDVEELPGYIDPDCYQPTGAAAFGEEMVQAIARLQTAFADKEKVTIWGDFDADGVTSTSVLWEGLGQFFSQDILLSYYIPNRLTESHGLNHTGIAQLAASGTKLIVTCDTGSTNITEIEYAAKLGIDVIVTDHHTLPPNRPPVTAIINPRYFPTEHPLYSLSGVATAYKLVEALYNALPHIPQQPLEYLLDLVAIGLIADLVELKGDCRYLAQQGIKQLKKQANPATANRPGVTKLLELCQKTGDRPTDISFGLGPRINAVSRIHGDASYVVELLTSQDIKRCQELASETELANTRRKSLQKDTLDRVEKKVSRLDLSTTNVIVLEDEQWQGGVLGLVAGQIAQQYNRPTILLNSSTDSEGNTYVKGSARSVNNIDLYQLVNSQAHLLHRFGGHPFAAGLSLLKENLPLFKQGIEQQLKQQLDITNTEQILDVDLTVTVADLGKNLFQELKLIEPCGMGNPAPKLLIKNCRFLNPWHSNIKDKNGGKVKYIKTTFNLIDKSFERPFPGLWWGHYKDEIPENTNCNVVVELDFNTFNKRYEVRLIDLQLANNNHNLQTSSTQEKYIIDRRNKDNVETFNSNNLSFVLQNDCPIQWNEIQQKYHYAVKRAQKLVLNYNAPETTEASKTWQQLIGIVKYLSRTKKTVSKEQIKEKLAISDRSFELGLQALVNIGFSYNHTGQTYQFTQGNHQIQNNATAAIDSFLSTVAEEQFQQRYFTQVPLPVITKHIES
ncbi:Single-stranded-DNA-specific exonuclease RecJ [Hyella patelloides LEGE 07179]|uniref:Single-stranded-DNA-specific exonuclease RecJ n=1 Tax=Hyella patelloides LEGE 07179 TaxID=945734 RepID=A0A563VSA6_9CYAN|nr:single-stranded-DNA-specific exonuclease RecJ [Hyella patelloides]VEP14277.1 Single-stranded-DNA-specific exonuclease RecJ [Hyella patelloides LEGE 07179]